MSEPLVVTISHRLGRDEAVARLKAGIARAVASFPVLKVDEQTWVDNRLTFRVRAIGQAASGTLDVGEDRVTLTLTLPWLLQKFAEVATRSIKQRGQLLLEKK